MLVAAGCVQPAGEVFPRIADAPKWPPPPAQARVEYVGSLGAESDLKPARSLWQRLTGTETDDRLVAPLDVTVSPSERVFVADRDRQAVHCFDLRSRTHETIGDGTLKLPTAVEWGDDRLFVADIELGQVFAWSPDQPRLVRFDKADLTSPSGLVYVDERHALYVSDLRTGRVVALDASGTPVATLPAEASGVTVTSPTHLAYHPGVGLLVCDAINARVVRLDLDGGFLGTLGSPGDGVGNLALPKGIAVDSEGHVYVVDARFENVQLFDGQGRALMHFGEEGVARGQFNLPVGICIDQKNCIWVADTYNCRVQVFRFLGSPEPVAQTLAPEAAGGSVHE